MDAKLHRALDTVGNVQKALLLIPTAGKDVPYCGIRGLSDPQQLRLQLCSTHEHDKWKKQIQAVKPK
jgi:hypothetical protein